jgi:hypothetical protein
MGGRIGGNPPQRLAWASSQRRIRHSGAHIALLRPKGDHWRCYGAGAAKGIRFPCAHTCTSQTRGHHSAVPPCELGPRRSWCMVSKQAGQAKANEMASLPRASAGVRASGFHQLHVLGHRSAARHWKPDQLSAQQMPPPPCKTQSTITAGPWLPHARLLYLPVKSIGSRRNQKKSNRNKKKKNDERGQSNMGMKSLRTAALSGPGRVARATRGWRPISSKGLCLSSFALTCASAKQKNPWRLLPFGYNLVAIRSSGCLPDLTAVIPASSDAIVHTASPLTPYVPVCSRHSDAALGCQQASQLHLIPSCCLLQAYGAAYACQGRCGGG